MSLLLLLTGRHDYSTVVTRSQKNPSTLQVDQDVLLNGARVGGVHIDVTFLNPDAQKQPDFTIAANAAPATLDQKMDMSYGGVVFCRVSVTAEPDAGIGHSIGVATQALNVTQPPLTMSATTVP